MARDHMRCAQSAGATRLWLRSLGWLIFLGPFFFITYGFANTWTSLRPNVASVVFDWERVVFPFVPMLALPYMSIDLFYGLSLFMVRTKKELDTHATRLLLATIISVICFLIFPLRFQYERPPVEGFNGFLLGMLAGFDKPFNQAPSLHVSLLILLWTHYARRCRGVTMAVIHLWFALIAISVLLTWQHHFIDVIGGIIVGFGVWYLLPDAAVQFRWSRSALHLEQAVPYWVGFVGLGLIAVVVGHLLWLLTWPAVSCCIVAAGYSGYGASVFQKGETGKRSLPATALLLPYLVAAHLSRVCFTKGGQCGATGQIGGLTLHAWPGPVLGAPPVLDLCAEFNRRHVFGEYVSVPMQDMVFPLARELDAAMMALHAFAEAGTVAVHCALGRGRSAVVAAAWLLEKRRAPSVPEAIATIRRACPHAVISTTSEQALENWWHERQRA